MKIRFRNPEGGAACRQADTGFGRIPARRPHVPAWRWYLFVMLLAAIFLLVVARFLFELLSLKGSGYLIYQTRDLVAPANLEVQQLFVIDGGMVMQGAPLLQARVRSSLPDSEQGEATLLSERLTLVALSNGVAEQVRVRQGQHVSVGTPMLALRTEAPPFVQAWMSAEYMDRLWVGRQAQIRFPDGSRLAAVISHVMASTERLPEGLSDSSRPGRSSLVIRLRLRDALRQQINFLPVEVRLRWRDDFSQWLEAGTEERGEELHAASGSAAISSAADEAAQKDR